MPKKPKAMMPQSTAGLIRYFEESEEAIKLKPSHVIWIAILVTLAVVMLKYMFFI